MAKVLVGGRYDGSVLLNDRREEFIYVAGSERKPRVFHRPPGRAKRPHLYRLDGRGIYLCASHTHTLCPGCDGFTEKDGACVGCGTPLPVV